MQYQQPTISFRGRKLGEGLYLNTTPKFFRGGLRGISRCVKASVQDAGVVVKTSITMNNEKNITHQPQAY